jgi:large subunit ribosomal protein L1
MNKENFKKAIELVKNNSPKRNFKQAYDLIINLKDLDMKKPDQQVSNWATLRYPKGKKARVCALVGPELAASAKENCDTVIMQDDFPKYAESKLATKKLAKTHDFFIAQANIMPDVAKTFGRVLGSRGKMPNPKIGCVVPPNANLKPLVEKLQKTVGLIAKTQLSIKCLIATDDMKDEEVLDNIMTVYNNLIHTLPAEERNIKNIQLKFTMGPPATITLKEVTLKTKKAAEEAEKK